MPTGPSTRRLDLLPKIQDLRRITKTLAALDAILSPEWQYRYSSFDSHWAPGAEMASMRNGSGDDYFLLFTEHGAVLKGFDHESEMSPYAKKPPTLWPGIYDGIPAALAGFLMEPAFKISDATFCVWRSKEDERWRSGTIVREEPGDPDGSATLLDLLDGNPEKYVQFAIDYYETTIPLAAVETVFRFEPLTRDIVQALNPDIEPEQLIADLEEIGYPSDLGL